MTLHFISPVLCRRKTGLWGGSIRDKVAATPALPSPMLSAWSGRTLVITAWVARNAFFRCKKCFTLQRHALHHDRCGLQTRSQAQGADMLLNAGRPQSPHRPYTAIGNPYPAYLRWSWTEPHGRLHVTRRPAYGLSLLACPMHMNAHGHTALPSRDQISLDDQGEQNKKMPVRNSMDGPPLWQRDMLDLADSF